MGGVQWGKERYGGAAKDIDDKKITLHYL
jgi:hypothetical protein